MLSQSRVQKRIYLRGNLFKGAGPGKPQLVRDAARGRAPVGEQAVVGDENPRQVLRVFLRREHMAEPQKIGLRGRKIVALGKGVRNLVRIARDHDARRSAPQLPQNRSPQRQKAAKPRILERPQRCLAETFAHALDECPAEGLRHPTLPPPRRQRRRVIPRRTQGAQQPVVEIHEISRLPETEIVLTGHGRHQPGPELGAQQVQDTYQRRCARSVNTEHEYGALWGGVDHPKSLAINEMRNKRIGCRPPSGGSGGRAGKIS